MAEVHAVEVQFLLPSPLRLTKRLRSSITDDGDTMTTCAYIPSGLEHLHHHYQAATSRFFRVCDLLSPLSGIGPNLDQLLLNDSSFCGKITDVTITETTDKTQKATVSFEKPAAAKTALMLNGGFRFPFVLLQRPLCVMKE